MIAIKTLILICSLVVLSACAGLAPVPGGGDTVNKSFYESGDDLKSRIANLSAGMSKEEVLDELGREEEDLIILSRSEIVSTIYGGPLMHASLDKDTSKALKSFSGYKLLYKNVERDHGINSPISMRTSEKGYSYAVSFIFENNRLYEEPILSGGAVDRSSSKTVFDYLNPSHAMKSVGL